jgi:predicted glycoside hydrolase/deacetylase ChbG (UPF0249 family)
LPSTPRTTTLLGYPPDARLLIVNADDFGMCHSINEAVLRAWREGIVTSTTLMTPCPWAPHAMQLLQANPGLPFGVHLTVVCDFPHYRWGPLSPWDRVPSLVDGAGRFHAGDQIPALLARASLAELEIEFRAQIAAVLAADLKPTHLDWHCLADGGRPDVFDLTLGLAREHGLALRVHDRSRARACRHLGLPAGDHDVLDSYRLDPADKPATYAQLLRDLPAGLSEWAVHPSLGNAESQALEPTTWPVRKTDLDFLLSRPAREILDEEGISLLDFRALQKAWSRQEPHARADQPGV